MEVRRLKCNSCGSDLQINAKIKFLNCSFCGSSLTIVNSGNAIFTEVINEIKEDTAILVDNSNTLLIEKEIERLDREWLIERERYKIKGKHSSDLPNDNTILMSIIALVLGIGFMLFFMHDAPGDFAIFGVFFVLILVGGTFSSIIKTVKYNNAKESYLRKRNSLLMKK